MHWNDRGRWIILSEDGEVPVFWERVCSAAAWVLLRKWRRWPWRSRSGQNSRPGFKWPNWWKWVDIKLKSWTLQLLQETGRMWFVGGGLWMQWSALDGCLLGLTPRNRLLSTRTISRWPVLIWEGRILGCNVGNCFCLLLPLFTQCINAAYWGQREAFLQGGVGERVSLKASASKRFSLLSFLSWAPMAGVGLSPSLVRMFSLQPEQMEFLCSPWRAEHPWFRVIQ